MTRWKLVLALPLVALQESRPENSLPISTHQPQYASAARSRAKKGDFPPSCRVKGREGAESVHFAGDDILDSAREKAAFVVFYFRLLGSVLNVDLLSGDLRCPTCRGENRLGSSLGSCGLWRAMAARITCKIELLVISTNLPVLTSARDVELVHQAHRNNSPSIMKYWIDLPD